MQDLINARLNGFAVELLVESYARHEDPPALTLVWRGVEVSLKVYSGPVATSPAEAGQ